MKNPCWIFNLVWVYTCMANKDDETSEFHHEPVSNKWYFLRSFVKKDGKHFFILFYAHSFSCNVQSCICKTIK